MISNSKIVTADEFRTIRSELRKTKKTVAHCHGVFDLLHPGHIAHLEEARALGDVLVVTVTAAQYVNKGPGRPYFSDELRMKSLAAIESVSYVVLSESVSAEAIIEVVQPDIYVKGREYADSGEDVTGNIEPEILKVKSFGGRVHFTDGIVFSSTRIINNEFPVFPPGVKEYMQSFSQRYNFAEIKEIIDRMKSLRVLVVGDIIIDEYVFCLVQGLMNKGRGLSARYLNEERYLGGVLAVARHIASFSDNVTLCGMIGGNEPSIHSRLLSELSRSMLVDLEFDEKFRTVVKRRFLERHGLREEYEKLFSINFFDEYTGPRTPQRESFHGKLEKMLPQQDLVVLVDFGHGLIDEQAMEICQRSAPFLAVNCQTNSGNYGTNLITKYHRADTFTLDQAELRLAFADGISDEPALLQKLRKHLQGTSSGWLTQGSMGSLSINPSLDMLRTPALTLKVQDTMGAGDAFFALSSLSACAGAPVEVGSFLGNIAGALAANVIGNAKPITKPDVLKFASTLLNI